MTVGRASRLNIPVEPEYPDVACACLIVLDSWGTGDAGQWVAGIRKLHGRELRAFPVGRPRRLHQAAVNPQHDVRFVNVHHDSVGDRWLR